MQWDFGKRFKNIEEPRMSEIVKGFMGRFIFLLLFAVRIFAAECENGMTRDEEVFASLEEGVLALTKITYEMNKMNDKKAVLQNKFVLLVMKKARITDDAANLLSTYFMQERLASKDPLLSQKLLKIHMMMLLLFRIKNEIDPNLVERLKLELTSFQRMFLSIKKPYLKSCPKRKSRTRLKSLPDY